jgi:uridine kinase
VRRTYSSVNNSSPYIIGISGGSGSGKTTFVRELKKLFSDEEMTVFSQDDYYRPRTEQAKDVNNEKNFDLPTSIDRDLYHSDLKRLIGGEIVEKMEYHYNNQLRDPEMKTFRPAKILLLEGIFVFYYEEIYKLMDLRIFIDSKDSIKVIRRIQRDRVERNYPLEDVLYRYEHHVSPTYEKYILPYKDKVDMVINNNVGFTQAMTILVQGLKCRLKKSG